MNKKIILIMLLMLTGFLSCYDALDTYEKSVVYNLRDRGPAGGWIFYVNPNWETDGWRYLEAAPDDFIGASWLSTESWLNGSSVAEGGTLNTIGSGKNNTAKILQYKGARTSMAAEYCDSYSVNGYSDWFLPSIDECILMYKNLKAYNVGMIITASYWSSSEATNNDAWFHTFNPGGNDNDSKLGTYRVRAIRAF